MCWCYIGVKANPGCPLKICPWRSSSTAGISIRLLHQEKLRDDRNSYHQIKTSTRPPVGIVSYSLLRSRELNEVGNMLSLDRAESAIPILRAAKLKAEASKNPKIIKENNTVNTHLIKSIHSGRKKKIHALVYRGQLVTTQTLGFVFNKLLRAQKIFPLTLFLLLEDRSDFGRKLIGSIC